MKKFVKDTSKKLATGALAILATIGGSSFGVGATSPNGTINVSGSGAAWTSGTDFQLSGVQANNHGTIPVSGYQTSKVYNYELNIAWGDMKFVFDRGVYNPSTDQLTKRVTNGAWQYCEAGVVASGAAATTGQGVGKWCGFDGTNNHVSIVNKGNGNVALGVSCTEELSNAVSTQTLGDVDMQIAVKSADIGVSYDNWVFTGDESVSSDQRTYTANMQDGSDISEMTIATHAGTAATTTIQKYMDLNGSVIEAQDRANEVEFYLNITGTPQQTATDGSTNSSELDTIDENAPTVGGNYWEQIGNINLTFTPSADSPRTPAVGN